jgi:hypothetical protein
VPTAHTSQTPASPDVNNGAAITTGVRFTVASATTCPAIAFYAPGTNSGTYTGALYQTTSDDSPGGTGTGTLLASATLGSGSVTPGAWNNISITPQSLSTGVVYTAAVHSSSGRIVATSHGLDSAIANGGVTLLAAGTDPNPPGLGSMTNGVFTENASLQYPNTSFNNTDYFIDVILSSGQSAALGTTAETDSTFALGRLKARAVGLASETDAAIAVGRRKTRAVGLASETDAAIALARVKARTLGLATSTEVALPLGRRKARALGVAAEADTAVHIVAAGGSARDLVLVVGPPETKWSAGAPGTKWAADQVGTKWATSRPEV